jgi:hypothetical protein
MNDTRLWAVKDSIEEGLRVAAQIVGGPRISPAAERDLAFGLRKDLMNAHAKLNALLADSLCLNYSSVGSCCYRNRDHDGAHLSEWGHTWTDDSDASAAAEMVRSMGGKTE